MSIRLASFKKTPSRLALTLWAALLLLPLTAPLMRPVQAEEAASQSLFTIKDATDSKLTLVPSIHLVPPGSTLLHKDKTLEELKAQPDGKEIEKLALADITFFEGQLQKKIGADKKLTVKEARFDVHQDFMGKKVTDLLSILYTVAKP